MKYVVIGSFFFEEVSLTGDSFLAKKALLCVMYLWEQICSY